MPRTREFIEWQSVDSYTRRERVEDIEQWFNEPDVQRRIAKFNSEAVNDEKKKQDR